MSDVLNSIAVFNISPAEVLFNLVVALVCGLVISRVYKLSYQGPGYTVSFINSLTLLALITAVVMMVIGNNLARAFGLVGAMSIIRFRTAVKDTQDIVFIFLALAVGMAAGVGYHAIAIIATIFISLVMFILTRQTGMVVGKQEYLLQFLYLGDEENADKSYQPVFDKYCRQYRVINVKSLSNGEAIELAFQVILKDKTSGGTFVRELGEIGGVSQVNLYFDEEVF